MSDIIEVVKNRDPGEREFHQAVTEVMESIEPVLERNPEYRSAKVLERIVEPVEEFFQIGFTHRVGPCLSVHTLPFAALDLVAPFVVLNHPATITSRLE